MNVPRARLCGWSGASAMPSTGDAHDCGVTSSASHSARVFSRNRAAIVSPCAAHACERVLLRHVDAEARAQLGVELRLHRTDREVLRVGGLVHAVVVRGAVDHVGLPAVLPPTFGEESVEDGHEHGRALEHGDVDDLADARRRGTRGWR